MTQRLFLSAASDDYKPTRVWLAEQLRPAGFDVRIQEELIELGQNTLVKLSESVRAESDVVLHLVGPASGSVPPADVLAAFLSRCGEAALRKRFPKLFEDDEYRRITYTQWEAWLALFHGKHVLPCRDVAAVGGTEAGLPVVDHLALLKAECGYAITFADRAELLDKIKSALLRLQNQGTFREDKPHNLPMATLGELFIGRGPFLDDLAGRFRRERALDRYPNHLIHGVGGVGKTRTAVEYGLSFGDRYTALLFVNGETAADLDRGLAGLSGVLALNLPPDATDPVRVRAVLDWLKAHPGWLLIVDNVDDVAARDAVNAMLREWHSGHVLITGRFLHWGKDVEPLELTVLSPADARDFLLKGTAGRRQARPDDADVARSIAVDDLGQLCLALEQATAYIGHRGITFAEYRRRWWANVKDVRTWADRVLMKYHEEKGVSLSVATTWQTSVEQLSADARRLLGMLSWLAPDPLPQTIFDGIEKAGGLPDTELPLVELRSFSLLQRETDVGFDCPGKVHRLVQLITREQLGSSRTGVIARLKAAVRELLRGKSSDSLRSILASVDSAAVGDPQDVRTWPIWTPLQPHILAVVEHADAAGIAEPTSRLMNQLGNILFEKALHAAAERLMRRVVTIFETAYGDGHPIVATALNNLAVLLQATTRPADAEPLMRRVLAIDEAAYGPDHPAMAIDLNNLAALLQATDRPADAEPLMRRALAIDEAALGPDHPDVARDLNNLAALLQATNRPADAEPLMRRVLAIDEAAYGPDHPAMAIDLNNLAALLQATNRLADAEPLMRRSLAIDEAAYGHDHPKVATRLNNLAQLLNATNRQADAEQLMRRALAIVHQFGRATGHQHPHVETALQNYRSLLEAMTLDADEIARRLAPFLSTTP